MYSPGPRPIHSIGSERPNKTLTSGTSLITGNSRAGFLFTAYADRKLAHRSTCLIADELQLINWSKIPAALIACLHLKGTTPDFSLAVR